MAQDVGVILGTMFREKRLKLGHTFDYMHRNYNIDPASLSEIEHGKIKNPSALLVKRITTGLRIPIQDVFDMIPL